MAEAANRGWPKPVQGDQTEVAGTHLLSPLLSAAAIVAPSTVMPVRSDSLVREYSWNEEEWAAGGVKFARALCMGLGMLKQDEKAKEVQASPRHRQRSLLYPPAWSEAVEGCRALVQARCLSSRLRQRLRRSQQVVAWLLVCQRARSLPHPHRCKRAPTAMVSSRLGRRATLHR